MGVKQADDEECADTYDKARQMIFVQEIHCCSLFLGANRNLLLDALFQGNQGLGSGYARNLLHLFVVQQIHQMLVVAGIYLGQHGVRTSGEVAFYDFRNLAQFRQLPSYTWSPFPSYVSAGSVSKGLGIYMIA